MRILCGQANASYTDSGEMGIPIYDISAYSTYVQPAPDIDQWQYKGR
jgi:hypothetical protein